MSREGTTQGDNLEMSFRAFGITPVLRLNALTQNRFLWLIMLDTQKSEKS